MNAVPGRGIKVAHTRWGTDHINQRFTENAHNSHNKDRADSQKGLRKYLEVGELLWA